MSEFLFHLFVFALGLSWTLLALPRLGAAVCCIQAYATGLALWVLSSLFVLLVGLPFDALTAFCTAAFIGVIAVGLILCAHTWKSGAPSAAAIRRLALQSIFPTTLFSFVIWAATRFDISIWTFDSHVIMGIARSIAHHGEIAPEMARELGSRGIFQVLVQSASLFIDKNYLSANPVVLAASFVASFVVFGTRALRHAGVPSVRAALATLLMIAAIASPYFFIVQSFYIHETLAAAVYLFFAATSFWFAEQERERAWLPFAFLYLLAFSLHRVDGPIVALILLVIVCGASRMPTRPINWGVLIFSVVILVWLGAQAMLQPPDGALLLRPAGPNLDSARLGVLMVAYVVSTGCLLSLRHPRMVSLRDWIPLLVIALLICALGAASIWRPSFADATVVGVIGIAAYPHWGGIWYIFLILGALSLLLPKEGHDRILSYGTLATLLFILLLSVMHDREFSSRWGDSINRMMIYLIPIFSFYLLMIYVRAPQLWDREKQLDPPSEQLEPVRETA